MYGRKLTHCSGIGLIGGIVLSLYLYTNMKFLPKGVGFVKDVDAFFGSSPLKDDSFTQNVLREIECADVFRSNMFIDRFGGALYTECLSTTSKILLSVAYHPEYVFNGAELGTNAYRLLLNIQEGHLYFENTLIKLPEDAERDISLYVNNHLCATVGEANARIGGYYA